MKRKLFYKIFAFTFGMMFLITVLAHVLIFVIAPSENILITSATITNSDVYAFSEVDMPRLITQTILKSFPLSILCCTVISLFFSFLFSKGITTPILSISNSVHKMSRLEQTAKITVTRTDEIGILANDINALYQALLVTIRNLEEEKDKVHLAEKDIMLYYFEGMTDVEIGTLFNTSRSTIQYRRTSSFEILKKYLEEHADEWDEW